MTNPAGLSFNETVALDAVRFNLANAEVDWTIAELMAIIQTESSFNPKAMRYEPRIKDTSYGLMQPLLGTARNLGYKNSALELQEPRTNVFWGIKYLDHVWDYFKSHLGRDPRMEEIIPSYNMGEHGVLRRVQQWIVSQRQQGEQTDGSDAPIFDRQYWDRWEANYQRWLAMFPDDDKPSE